MSAMILAAGQGRRAAAGLRRFVHSIGTAIVREIVPAGRSAS